MRFCVAILSGDSGGVSLWVSSGKWCDSSLRRMRLESIPAIVGFAEPAVARGKAVG